MGVVQAARWERGQGHKRTNFLAPAPSAAIESVTKNKKSTQRAPSNDNLTNVNTKRSNKRQLEENTDAAPSYARGGRSVSPVGRSTAAPKGTTMKHLNNRDMAVFKAAQNKSVNRLASLVDSGKKIIGEMVQFRCRDGVTKMPYVVIGSIPLKVERCNFIVIHDFFDTCDGTSILFKPLV